MDRPRAQSPQRRPEHRHADRCACGAQHASPVPHRPHRFDAVRHQIGKDPAELAVIRPGRGRDFRRAPFRLPYRGDAAPAVPSASKSMMTWLMSNLVITGEDSRTNPRTLRTTSAAPGACASYSRSATAVAKRSTQHIADLVHRGEQQPTRGRGTCAALRLFVPCRGRWLGPRYSFTIDQIQCAGSVAILA
jgi:hypothetical protein